MAEESKAKQEEQLPVGIKLFDNVWLLLALGFLVPGGVVSGVGCVGCVDDPGIQIRKG